MLVFKHALSCGAVLLIHPGRTGWLVISPLPYACCPHTLSLSTSLDPHVKGEVGVWPGRWPLAPVGLPDWRSACDLPVIRYIWNLIPELV